MSDRNPFRRRAGVLALVALTAAVAASPATAHVHTDPMTVKPGARATVAFRITHGCDGSPTVKVALRLPAGVTRATPVAVAGWKASARGRVVTWSGGRLAPTATQAFALTATFPATEGVLAFPMVQTCVKGENAWIDPTVAGQPEPAHPAPMIGVGVAVPAD